MSCSATAEESQALEDNTATSHFGRADLGGLKSAGLPPRKCRIPARRTARGTAASTSSGKCSKDARESATNLSPSTTWHG
eukprot:10770059-Alexandrium_andersonii.AAC.1